MDFINPFKIVVVFGASQHLASENDDREGNAADGSRRKASLLTMA